MLELRALGPVDLRADDGRAIHSVVAQPKRLALLLYLTVARPGALHRRDTLLPLFWPDSDEKHARNALSQALHHLRRSLGEETIVARGADEVGVQGERVWCDVAAFERAIGAGEPAEAVELYRAPFLEGFALSDAPEWEHWVAGERTRLGRMVGEALERLAGSREAAGDLEGALALWHRLEAADPLSPRTAIRLMRALAWAGERAAAIAHARSFQARLQEEFEAEPDPEVEALAERLRGGEMPVDRPSGTPSRRDGSGPGAAAAGPEPPRVRSLPVPPTRLMGREAEVETVRRTLLAPGVRLVTLTGTAGIGKTRLALEVARDLAARQGHEVAFVELAPLADADQVLPEIARVLGLREAGPLSVADALREHLRPRGMLLVLDNFEHVTSAAPDVAALMGEAPRLKVLVTSRAPLRVAGEHELPLTPLRVPEPATELSEEELLGYGAVELFVARARAVRGSFALTPASAREVVEVCARLDGLPLAIELAAARVRVLTPQQLLSRLGSRLELLTGGARDLPARQQTLRSAIEWSYELLDEEERALFRRLAVFRAAWPLDAAEAVCGVAEERDGGVIDGLESLVAKSLLSRAEDARGEARFRMLETLREYARERLDESEESEAARRRHAGFFLALAEEAEPHLTGGSQVEWLRRLEDAHEDFRAVLEWARERGDAGVALRLTGALWRFWWMHGHLGEGRRWIGEALATPGEEAGGSDRWRARALLAASALALHQGDLSEARATGDRALRTFRALGDRQGIATSLSRLGQAAWTRGDLAAAREHFDGSLSLLEELGDLRARASVLNNLGGLAIAEGRHEEAHARYAECLSLSGDVGDRELISSARVNLGMLAYRVGDLETARARLEAGIDVARAIGSTQHLAVALNTLGLIARDLDEPAVARAHLEESCALLEALGDRHGLAHSVHSLGSALLRAGDVPGARAALARSLGIFRELGIEPPPDCLVDLGELALRQGRIERAARLLGAASAPGTAGEMASSDRARLEALVADARGRADAEAWEGAWAEGRSMGVAEAAALAAGEVLPREDRQVGEPSA